MRTANALQGRKLNQVQARTCKSFALRPKFRGRPFRPRTPELATIDGPFYTSMDYLTQRHARTVRTRSLLEHLNVVRLSAIAEAIATLN